MATGVDARLLKSTRFPPTFNQKVDMQKVNLQVMKKWIAGKIAAILGNDDDVVIELCYNLIESSRNPDIKALQIQLTGFLELETPSFCKELWTLLLSAQSSPQGIPRELLEAKKMELIQEKIEAEKAAEESRRKREGGGRFDRDRPPRGDDRGDTWRGGAGGRRRGAEARRGGGGGGGGGGWGRDRSRSPPGRGRDYRDQGGYRARHDLYVPSDRRGRGGRRDDIQRRRAPSRSNSRSHSRSPPRSPSVKSISSRSRSHSKSYSRSPSRHRLSADPGTTASGKRQMSPQLRVGGDRRRGLSNSRSPAPKRRRRSPSPTESHSHRGRRSVSSVSLSGPSRRSASSGSENSPRWRKGRDRNRDRGRGRSRGRSDSISLEMGGGEGLRHRGIADQGREHRRGSEKRPLSRNLSRSSGDGMDYDRRRHIRSEIIREENRETHERPALRQSPSDRQRRINTSSVSSRSISRDKSADIFNKEDRPTAKTTVQSAVTVANSTSAALTSGRPQATQRLSNEQREKELKEKIKQMRSSMSGPSSA